MKAVIKGFLYLMLISIILGLVNQYPILLLIPIGYVAYKIYKIYIEPARTQEKAKKVVLQKINLEKRRKDSVRPYISKYLQAFTSAWQIWPTKIVLSQYDYKSIRSLVEKEAGADCSSITDSAFKELVDEQLLHAGFLLFSRNFASSTKDIVVSEISLYDKQTNFIKRYYDIFGQNPAYIVYLVHYLEENTMSITAEDVKIRLQKISHDIAIDKRSKDIETSLSTHAPIVTNIDINYIDKLEGIEFEQILGELFGQMGYESTVTKASGDQGADLLISKGGERKVVQAKRYNHPVSNSAVQEAVAAKAFYKYPQATVVTNNFFTNGAIELAKANGVELIDRSRLKELLFAYPLPKP